MKKMRLFIALIVVSVFAISCDSDDDNNTNQPIVGTWEITNVDVFERYIFNGEEEIYEESFTTQNCDPTPFLRFSAGGELTVSDFEIDFDDIVENEVFCFVDGQLNGTWAFVSNNRYLLVVDGEGIQVEINFLNNNNTLQLIADDSDEDEEFILTYQANRI